MKYSKDEILNDIYACIEAINLTLPENVRMPLEKNSLLVDTDSIFDSLSTINFFVSLEELYLSKGLSIQLLDEDLLIEEGGPYKSINTLSEFILNKIN